MGALSQLSVAVTVAAEGIALHSAEAAAGTDPNDTDSDEDGVLDGFELNASADTDGDGLINALDPDSDNDGLFDGTELGLGCDDPATDAGAGTCVPDADGGDTKTNPLDADTDDGGVGDGAEDANHDGALDEGETDPTSGNGGDDTTTDEECALLSLTEVANVLNTSRSTAYRRANDLVPLTAPERSDRRYPLLVVYRALQARC